LQPGVMLRIMRSYEAILVLSYRDALVREADVLSGGSNLILSKRHLFLKDQHSKSVASVSQILPLDWWRYRNLLTNTLLALRRLQSLAFGFGTSAYAEDRASLPHDGLLRRSRHRALQRRDLDGEA
jgi:hypothetical protein